MAVYDEKTHILIENPDLEKGYTYPGKLLITDKQNSVELEGSDGLRSYYPDPLYEDCEFYHEYTKDEIEAINLLKTSYSVQQSSPRLSYKVTTVYLDGYDVTGPDYTICFGTWGSYGIEQLQVIRGEGWEDLTITATFNVKGKRKKVVVPETGLINVPPEATRYPLDGKNPGYIVFTGVSKGVQRNSKNLMFLVYGHAEVDLMNEQSTPSEWEQFVTLVKEYVDASEQRVKEYSDNAAKSEEAAKTAQNGAEEALAKADEVLAKSLRTLHGGVVKPDSTGDFDPSRPYESEIAESITVKSKGNRFQSATVYGFTKQDGSGDPSPTNVREISTAGMRMVAATFDGSADENWQKSTGVSGNAYCIPVSNALMKGIVFASYAAFVENSVLFSLTSWAVSNGGSYNYIRLSAPLSDLVSFKQYLQSNPITVWYTPVDVSQSPGLYIPKIAQGHEYRCQMMKLTAPLCDGDKVESCVPSGCDVKLVFDGSSDENWSQNESSGSKRFVIPVNDIPITDQKSGRGFSNSLYLAPTGGTGVIGNSFCFTVGSDGNLYVKTDGKQTLEQFRESLAEKNLVFYFRSTAYTEANDISVQLETHASAIVTVDGTNTLFAQGTDGYAVTLPGAANGAVTCNCFANLTAARNTVTIPTSQFPASVTSLEQANTWAQSNPVTILYTLASPAIYAHDPVTIVAIPYTQADVDAANRLANTPSTLPTIDSPDIPMLLNETEAITEPLAAVVPVAGTYIVKSQEGTTVSVLFKAIQDGGDAETLNGNTLTDLQNNILAFLGSVLVDRSKFKSVCRQGDFLFVKLTGNTGVNNVQMVTASEIGNTYILTCKSGDESIQDISVKAKIYRDRIELDDSNSDFINPMNPLYCESIDIYRLGGWI